MKELALISIIIPTYNPKIIIKEVIKSLTYHKDIKDKIIIKKILILIVDDASDKKESIKIINELKKNEHIKIIRNQKNLGQGGSIKQGLSHLIKLGFKPNVLTCDDDGQHHIEDIVNIINYKLEKKDAFVIGQRNFDKNIPLKSYIGNKISAYITKLFFKIDLDDTQSGLRKYNFLYAALLLNIKNNGFDFNIIAILKAIRKNYQIKKINIKTIYLERNKLTNFRSVKDSLKVILAILKFRLFKDS